MVKLTTFNKYTAVILFFFSLFYILTDEVEANNNLPMATMEEVYLSLRKYKDLPIYCQIRLAQRDIEWVAPTKRLPPSFAKICKRWEKKIGPQAWRCMHHYAWGIQLYRKATRMKTSTKDEKNRRKAVFKEALSNFNFIKSCINKHFPLWYDLLIHEALIYSGLNQTDLAIKRRMQAKRLKSKRKK